MPTKPARPCNFPLCPNTVKGNKRYCNDHEQYEKAIFEDYDKRRIDKNKITPKNFYRLARWRRVRKMYARNHPYCEICEREGRGPIPMRIVDHIIEIEDGGAWYDENNLQSLCMECSNRKTFSKENK